VPGDSPCPSLFSPGISDGLHVVPALSVRGEAGFMVVFEAAVLLPSRIFWSMTTRGLLPSVLKVSFHCVFGPAYVRERPLFSSRTQFRRLP